MTGKTLSLIGALSGREKIIFARYLEEKNKEILSRLYLYLVSNCDHSKRSAFNACFPGKKFDDKKFRYVLSDLGKEVKKFILLRSLKKEKKLEKQVLSKELLARGATRVYEQLVHEEQKDAAGSAFRNADFHLSQFIWGFNKLSYEGEERTRDKKDRIREVMAELDRFYILKKLQLSCEVINPGSALPEQDIFLLEEIESRLDSGADLQSPVVRMYYNMLMTLKDNRNEENFHNLRKLLNESGVMVPRTELRDIYQCVFNYCIRKINTGNVEWQETLYEAYKEALVNEALLQSGHLSQWDYKNIVTISLRLGKHAWAYDFIKDYRYKLKDSERENAYLYNLATWYYNTGNFSKSLRHLQKVKFTDLYYQFDARTTILKIYFDLNDVERFNYQAEAFKTALRRNKDISDYQRTIYRNFIKFTGQLLAAGKIKVKVAKVKLRIENEPQVADLKWLLKKVSEKE
jgi:hypothetical protein